MEWKLRQMYSKTLDRLFIYTISIVVIHTLIQNELTNTLHRGLNLKLKLTNESSGFSWSNIIYFQV